MMELFKFKCHDCGNPLGILDFEYQGEHYCLTCLHVKYSRIGVSDLIKCANCERTFNADDLCLQDGYNFYCEECIEVFKAR